jgi:hypothetical protein
MDADEKKRIIGDAAHNEWHGQYRNPNNAPSPTEQTDIKKELLYPQEEGIGQE